MLGFVTQSMEQSTLYNKFYLSWLSDARLGTVTVGRLWL